MCCSAFLHLFTLSVVMLSFCLELFSITISPHEGFYLALPPSLQCIWCVFYAAVGPQSQHWLLIVFVETLVVLWAYWKAVRTDGSAGTLFLRGNDAGKATAGMQLKQMDHVLFSRPTAVYSASSHFAVSQMMLKLCMDLVASHHFLSVRHHLPRKSPSSSFACVRGSMCSKLLTGSLSRLRPASRHGVRYRHFCSERHQPERTSNDERQDGWAEACLYAAVQKLGICLYVWSDSQQHSQFPSPLVSSLVFLCTSISAAGSFLRDPQPLQVPASKLNWHRFTYKKILWWAFNFPKTQQV